MGETDVIADTLVGADGANGIVAKAIGLEDGIVRGVALEGNVGWEHLDRERYASTAVVELGQPDGGYGWLFPKGEHANLGVGGWDREGPHLRDHLARLSRSYGIDPDVLTERPRPPAADAPRRRHDSRPATTWFSSAMRQGSSIRSRATGCTRRSRRPGSRPTPSSPAISRAYPAALAQRLDHHAGASWSAKRALDRHPAVCFWAARSPGVFGVVSGLLRGDVGHPNEARGLARPPLRLVARVARRV